MTENISFFKTARNIQLGDLAKAVDGKLNDGVDTSFIISSAGPIEAAASGSLTFIDNPKYVPALKETQASVVICSKRNLEHVPDNAIALVAPLPYRAFATAMAMLFPSAMRPQPIVGPGIAKGAYVDPTATLEDDVTVEHGAVVGPHAHIGAGSLIGPCAVVGAQVKIGRRSSICGSASVLHALIGDDVIIHSGVRIGNDGFGFAMGLGGHQKIPQVGRVVIQDKVEIGANTCIDRGSNRDTIIGEGTKIDNLVMIAHNVVIGQHCVIVGQTGIAGSAELGDYVVLGGQTAINGHLKIGSGAQIAGLSGVSGDVPPGVQWGGVPARPIKHWMRDIARSRREAFAMQNKNKKDSNKNG